jgi:hypothetical protein
MSPNQYNILHGYSKQDFTSPTYHSWANAKKRCVNPNADQYEWYGERGIKMCAKWFNSFKAFLKDMGEKPKGMTLERVNNDGDYTPENCKWATHKENCRNRRTTRWVNFNGEKLTFKEFAEKYCTVKQEALYARIAQGWTMEQIIKRYVRKGVLCPTGQYVR